MLTTSTIALKEEISEELENILHYWQKFSIDEVNGGFVGKRNHQNIVDKNASKGIILNTRILWTFSAISNHKKYKSTLEYAQRAYQYLLLKFQDHENGGVFWELDAWGNPLNKRKQIYAHAFAIYALSEYFTLTEDETANAWALSLFHLIEKHAHDNQKQGYIEAFNEEWHPIADMRLSDKDFNAAKTMNTHLHVLEAYTSLFVVTGNSEVKEALENLINLMLNRFYNSKNHHFKLFFNERWDHLDQKISYGHDIEALWLLIEAAKSINNTLLLESIKSLVSPIIRTFLAEAYSKGRGIINEKDISTKHVDTDRHWWPQAEAMVGLHYAYEITQNSEYLDALKDIWNYTKENIIDHKNGEWFFRVDENNIPYEKEDKVGMWKCPYHNSRALIILLKKM